MIIEDKLEKINVKVNEKEKKRSELNIIGSQ